TRSAGCGTRGDPPHVAADALEPARGRGAARRQLQGASVQDQRSRVRSGFVMAPELYLDQRSRVLTPEAFPLVLHSELKRALRTQNYLTLLVLEPTPVAGGERGNLTREVAHLVHRQVRETDLLSETPAGQLAVVLLDADLQNANRV